MAATPLEFTNASFTIEGDEYADAISRARLVPNQEVVRYRTAVPNGDIVKYDIPTWTLELNAVQDWAATGIAKAINDGADTDLACVLAPSDVTGQPTRTFTIRGRKLPFGGDRGPILSMEETFEVVGQPTEGTVAV